MKSFTVIVDGDRVRTTSLLLLERLCWAPSSGLELIYRGRRVHLDVLQDMDSPDRTFENVRAWMRELED